jgi:hypothetical protein
MRFILDFQIEKAGKVRSQIHIQSDLLDLSEPWLMSLKDRFKKIFINNGLTQLIYFIDWFRS